VFLAPKHTNFVRRFIRQVAVNDSTVLDCFGGSGSTADAVIHENRENGTQLKYVLVEVNNYFDTVLLPRALKSAYSSHWKSGRPVTRDGMSQVVKVIRLESYEDALNNLDIQRPNVGPLLNLADGSSASSFKEAYLLRYMLDVETRGSQSLLNIKAFVDPRAYRLKVKRPGSDESAELCVDLLETFNWLLGLTVTQIAPPVRYSASLERAADPDLARDVRSRLRVKGRLVEDVSGKWWFRAVRGTTPQMENVLIIWRTRPGGDAPAGVEEDNAVLDAWLSERAVDDIDVLYVNGSNTLTAATAGKAMSVRLIEEAFHRLMFEVLD
jgi:adenine-specific DNA-methyltransferase